jgi:hypothetical protein
MRHYGGNYYLNYYLLSTDEITEVFNFIDVILGLKTMDKLADNQLAIKRQYHELKKKVLGEPETIPDNSNLP